MNKKIFDVKVSDIPFYPKGMKISKEDKSKYGLYGSCAYRLAFARGLGGSIKEKTWDKINHIHKCCGAMVPWRHHGNCPGLGNRNKEDDLSDLKEISQENKEL